MIKLHRKDDGTVVFVNPIKIQMIGLDEEQLSTIWFAEDDCLEFKETPEQIATMVWQYEIALGQAKLALIKESKGESSIQVTVAPATFREAYERLRQHHIHDCQKHNLHPNPEDFANMKISELGVLGLLGELDMWAGIIDDERGLGGG